MECDKLPRLLVPRNKAKEQLSDRIKKGQNIMNCPINKVDDLDHAISERDKWSDYNIELLTRLFDNSNEIVAEYVRARSAMIVSNTTFDIKVTKFKKDMRKRITKLETIADRLDLIPDTEDAQEKENSVPGIGNRVFIVHGHDEAAKETVARFIERLPLKVVILHEQANQGRTIIEKLEGISQVDYAVVLFTPDDVGAGKDQRDNLQPRARQNVVFELGWFCGYLGWERVCVLYKEGVEILTDYLGVCYVKFDADGGWKLPLARELKKIGFEFDLNNAL